MVKTSHDPFPPAGLALHISPEDALANGIKPGDPAIVEVTVRPCTAQEWIAEGSARTFQTQEEAGEYFGRCPVPGADPAPVADPVAVADPAAAVAPEPAATEPADDPPLIRWRSAGRVAGTAAARAGP